MEHSMSISNELGSKIIKTTSQNIFKKKEKRRHLYLSRAHSPVGTEQVGILPPQAGILKVTARSRHLSPRVVNYRALSTRTMPFKCQQGSQYKIRSVALPRTDAHVSNLLYLIPLYFTF